MNNLFSKSDQRVESVIIGYDHVTKENIVQCINLNTTQE